MIAYLEGELIDRGPEAIVAMGGVGMAVQLSLRGAEQLPPVGQSVRLWTHLVTREEGWVVYGFLDQQEREMFRMLISVSGVGPKLALSVLSGAPPADLALFLSSGDEKSLVALPGIGRKTAARLVVELGQRIPTEWLAAHGGTTGEIAAVVDEPGLREAVDILCAMGLPVNQAEKALLAARVDDHDLPSDMERWVRNALNHL